MAYTGKYAHKLETDLNDYKGSLEAISFEGPAPTFPPKNVIRKDQNWGINVNWEMFGPLANWLDGEFRVNVYLERIGTGADVDLPQAIVATLSGTESAVVANGSSVITRDYHHTVSIPAGSVAAGLYKVSVALQLFERATGNATPVAGFAHVGSVFIFDPGP
ncbi:MAG: hypothetical protein SF029_26915 [bacterium]|nr:hypothetical protein [bacterium]